MTPRVEVQGATVRFGTAPALDDLHLAVEPGEVVMVLGPSGSGKSTLLRAVAGLQGLDAGRVLLDGVDQAGVPPHRRGVGLMFQDHALFPHLDVGGNVAFGLRMQGRPRPEVARLVAEHLGLVGLGSSTRRAVHTLSGGEQQRVALARALAPAPRVLLLDEPLGSLDRPRREQLVAELRELFGRLGTTVLAVTHDHAEAFALGDRVALLDGGRLLQEGEPRQVWERPASRRAAELLGFPNLGDAEAVAGGLRTPWGVLDARPGTGSVTAVAVRPEGVRLGSSGSLQATVVLVTFTGSHQRVQLRIAGAPDLEAVVPLDLAVRPGDRVRVAIAPGAVVALPS